MQKFMEIFCFLYTFPSIVFTCSVVEFNKEHSNKRLLGYTVLNLTVTGLGTCVRRCMGVSRCRSYNFRSPNLCELNAMSSNEVWPGELETQTEWVFGDIALWPKAISGDCENKVCGSNQECISVVPGGLCVDFIKVMPVAQWANEVITFSSEDPSPSWSAAQVLGPSDEYEWVASDNDANQYIEVGYTTPVYITQVDIYEVWHAGGVKSISARDPEGTLHMLWETPEVTLMLEKRIFSPPIETTSFRSSRLRLDIDNTSDRWYDAIKLHGIR